jgi:hypothetical protein
MSTVTDFEIAECRLSKIISKNTTAPVSWNQAPYYGKASVDTAGGYNGWCKIAYNFRLPKKNGFDTKATNLLIYIATNHGETPSEIRKALQIKEGCCSSLFTNAKLWMLVKSEKGKYYITSTGLKYLEKMVGIKYYKVRYYDWKDGLCTRFQTNLDMPGKEVRYVYNDGRVSFYVNKDNSFSFNAVKVVENDKKVQTAAADMTSVDTKAKQRYEEIGNEISDLHKQIAILQKQREDITEELKRGRYIKLNLDGRYKKEELTKIFNEILDNY